MEWIEWFFAWKLGGKSLIDCAAKDADALLVLEEEWREANNGFE
jgi:hypothetical protein